MKYVLNKDLPTFKAGTEAWLSKRGNLLTKIDGKEITMYSHSTLDKFPNILTEWFEPIPEKRKAVPHYKDIFYVIGNAGSVRECTLEGDERAVAQGNWRWTREEAEAEVAKRAAIERVRRYLVNNDLIEEDRSNPYEVLFYHSSSGFKTMSVDIGSTLFYSPYGRIKDTDLTQFLEDCREDLLLIHS